jgi:butyryl-CoA dehydrogenase
VGVARRAFTRSLDGLRGEHISQNTEFSASDSAVDVDAAALAVQRAAWVFDQGGAHLLESSVAKAFATTAASRVAHRALRMAHNSGGARELRRCYLDAQFLEGFGGPETLHEDTIATLMLQET